MSVPKSPQIRLPDADQGGIPETTTLYVDGIKLEDLDALYRVNTQVLGGQGWNDPNRFWAATPRKSDSKVRDVLEVNFNSGKWVNRFTWQVSRFPCRMWLQYQDMEDGQWRSVIDKKTKKKVQITIQDSVPARIYSNVHGNSHRHPHHHASGHWQTITISSRLVFARRFRIVLTHIPSKRAPRDIITKKPAAYSLAIRDFQAGHAVSSLRDIPRCPVPPMLSDGKPTYLTPVQQAEESITFGSSIDLLGSPVEFSVIEHQASDLLWSNIETAEGISAEQRAGDRDIWKSEPQPVAHAVVNLYVDARDAMLQPQMIDRFWINPITNGVSCNLYYSMDIPDVSEGFSSSDNPLRFPVVRPSGSLSATSSGIFLGDDQDPSVPGFLDIDNTILQWGVSNPWWVGIKFRPAFGSTEAVDHTVLESRRLTIRWMGTEQCFGVWIYGQRVIVSLSPFSANEEIPIVVTWRESGDFTVHSRDDFMDYGTNSFPLTSNLDPALEASTPSVKSLVRLGGRIVASGSPVGQSNLTVSGMVIKQEEATAQQVQEFFDLSLDNYLLKPERDSDDPDYTDNSILRCHPYFQSKRSPYGFVGGAGHNYESMMWTPINRDYRLHQGDMKFDPVMARFFKFEFTDLVATPYNTFEPVSRRVRLFTAQTISESAGQRRGPRDEASPLGGSGNKINAALGAQPIFSDQRSLETVINPMRSYGQVSPVQAITSRDPKKVKHLSSLSPALSMVQWHQPTGIAPRFVKTQRHYYQTVEVDHEKSVAYFVGLKGLRMFRVDYSAADDTDCYIYTFDDAGGLDLSANEGQNWNVSGSALVTSPDALGYSVTQSQVLRSRRPVRGVQFATHQTMPQQRLSDPDFLDPNLSSWRAFGAAEITPTRDFETEIGSSVKVGRKIAGAFWGYLEIKYPTWQEIEDSLDGPLHPTWDEFSAPEDQALPFGGVESTEIIEMPEMGRVYVAARVYSPTPLSGDMHVQIVDESGEVLADDKIAAPAGGISEWYASYTLGDFDFGDSRTWAEVEVAYPLWSDIDGKSWPEITLQPISILGRRVFVRVYQDGTTLDEFYIENISLFQDSIVWEFSNNLGQTWWPVFDIKNNPDGVFIFPRNPGETIGGAEGTSLMWRVRGYQPESRISHLVIRPWYSSHRRGIPVQDGIEQTGPNMSPFDQFPEIHQHAPFCVWNKPIPEHWWFHYRQRVLTEQSVFVEPPSEVSDVLGEAFIFPVSQ